MTPAESPSIRLKPVVFLLLVLLLGGVLFVLLGVTRTVQERLVVVRSGGGSLGGRDRVIVRGDRISYGDRVKVLNRPLVVSLEDTSVTLGFEPGSTWRYTGRYTDERWPEVSVRQGRGWAHARERALRLVFPSKSIHLQDGMLRWRQDKRSRNVSAAPGARGYFVDEGSTIPLEKVLAHREHFERPDVDEGVPARMSGPPAQTSSLISGDRLRRQLERHARRTGNYPGTLRALFGHWVRDRWGNVYYYDRKGNGFTVVSGGADGRLFTDDDRRWTE